MTITQIIVAVVVVLAMMWISTRLLMSRKDAHTQGIKYSDEANYTIAHHTSDRMTDDVKYYYNPSKSH